jgi:hypothetical protein
VNDWPPEDRLRDALKALRDDLEHPVTADDARAAVAATHAAVTRTRRRRQRIIAALAALVIASGVVSTLPQGRQAIAGVVDRLGTFLTGGGDAPGAPPPPEEPAALLNLLINERPGTERVIAQRGNLRMLAYRNKKGEACISIGTGYVFCAPSKDWNSFFADGVVAPLLSTPAKGEDIVPLWGLATAQVTTVRVTYADGSDVQQPVVGYGFIVPVDGQREPLALEALGQSGRLLARADVSTYGWRSCPGPNPCP